MQAADGQKLKVHKGKEIMKASLGKKEGGIAAEELFGLEDMDMLMDNVSGRECLDHMVEDMIDPDDSDVSMEDATAGKNGEVDMADSSSGKEEGHLESLMGEEGSSDYDCQAEDEDGMEEED
ncbi:hypothetical protein BS17DRAFT_770532 [Gyrodon lividus]|nr:hypothetical protein BS17DRAFT_770532 [Gyrodon lividus]